MEDLDFSQPAPAAAKAAAVAPPPHKSGPDSLYNPALALKFFQIAGEPETLAAGTKIFAEQDKSGGFFAKYANEMTATTVRAAPMIATLATSPSIRVISTTFARSPPAAWPSPG